MFFYKVLYLHYYHTSAPPIQITQFNLYTPTNLVSITYVAELIFLMYLFLLTELGLANVKKKTLSLNKDVDFMNNSHSVSLAADMKVLATLIVLVGESLLILKVLCLLYRLYICIINCHLQETELLCLRR